MIICNKCGKENQDRFKFCLGCGAQLGPQPGAQPPPPAKAAAAPAGPVRPTPPAGVPGKRIPPELAVTEPEEPAPAGPVLLACRTCGTKNPKEFLFCGNCGARMAEAGAPTAGLRQSPANVPKPAPKPRAFGKLALIRPDGSEGGEFPLTEARTAIGRGIGPLFDNDSYLSPRHAMISFADRGMLLEDTDSLNGVFVKITQEEQITDGTVFRIGQELLRFDEIKDPIPLEDGTEVMGSPNPGYHGRLSIIVGPGSDGSAFPLMGEEIVLGRERGDILFSDDGYVSGTHAKVSVRSGGFFLSDLGSSNGTFIKIDQAREISSGTFILLGQQLFRVDHL